MTVTMMSLETLPESPQPLPESKIKGAFYKITLCIPILFIIVGIIMLFSGNIIHLYSEQKCTDLPFFCFNQCLKDHCGNINSYEVASTILVPCGYFMTSIGFIVMLTLCFISCCITKEEEIHQAGSEVNGHPTIGLSSQYSHPPVACSFYTYNGSTTTKLLPNGSIVVNDYPLSLIVPTEGAGNANTQRSAYPPEYENPPSYESVSKTQSPLK